MIIFAIITFFVVAYFVALVFEVGISRFGFCFCFVGFLSSVFVELRGFLLGLCGAWRCCFRGCDLLGDVLLILVLLCL